MRRVDVTRYDDGEPHLLKPVSSADFDTVVHAPAALYEDGVLVGLLLRPEAPTARVLEMLREAKYQRAGRTGGLYSHSRTFGFRPRIAMHHDFCSACTFGLEFPELNDSLVQIGADLSETMRRYNPEQWEAQHGRVNSEVRSDWIMPGTGIFTSGIVNKSNALHYHRDTGNFAGSWNAMLVLLDGMHGGKLVLPSYRVALGFTGAEVVFMDAQRQAHGVEQMHPKTPDGIRFSVVYYALQQMRLCGTPAEELDRVKEMRTQRARRQHSRNRGALAAELTGQRRKKGRTSKERMLDRRQGEKES
jgi:hypothetical protein